MRRLENYVRKYGPEFGRLYYHTLQSQAAHAQVASRLRRKLDVLSGRAVPPARPAVEEALPLFGTDNPDVTPEPTLSVPSVA